MFSTILRAGALLVAGSVLYIPFRMLGTELEARVAATAPAGSNTAHWIGVTVTWVPMIVIAMACVALISGSVARRRV